MLDTLLAFLALLFLCVFLHGRLGVHSAVSPLLALGIVVLYFSLAGVFGVLLPAGWVFYIAAFGLCLYTLCTKRGREGMCTIVTPGFVLFVGGCLVLLFYFALRKPLFSEWDEFANWGTFAKLLKQDNRLYTTADIGWFWTATQSPGLPVLGYFAQFFGGEFTPWKLFWAYDALMLAAGGALLASFTFKSWRTVLPLGLVAVLIPYFFGVFFRQVHLNKTYMTAYVDTAAGMFLGGVLAVYFVGRLSGKKTLWQALLPLAAFALVKDNLFPLALLAAGIMIVDTCLFVKAEGLAVVKKILVSAAVFGAALLPYVLWRQHANWANSLNPTTNGALTSMPIEQALIEAVRQLLNPNLREAKFNTVLSNLGQDFLKVPVSMAGAGLTTCLLIVFLFIFAAVLHQDTAMRKRIVATFVLLVGGFFGYQLVLLVSYGFIFKMSASDGLVDYNRYMSAYYISCFIVALFFLALAARQKTQGEEKKNIPAWRRVAAVAYLPLLAFVICYHTFFSGFFGQGAHASIRFTVVYYIGWVLFGVLVLALSVLQFGKGVCAAKNTILVFACAGVFLFASLVPPGLSMLDFPTSAYARQHALQQQAEGFVAHLQPGERVFFVCQGGDGLAWFQYSYHLLPSVLDYSMTGGFTLAPPVAAGDEAGVTLQQLEEYLAQKECTSILVTGLDEEFIAAYGALFTDELRSFAGEALLYQRDAAGLYAPIA